MTWFLVFLGGGIGSLSRYLISYHNPSKGDFPWATFLTNMLACLILGWLFGIQLKSVSFDTKWKLFLMTGFCGGFSTFSTYGLETINLLQEGKVYNAIIYVTTSTILGLILVFAGYKISGI